MILLKKGVVGSDTVLLFVLVFLWYGTYSFFPGIIKALCLQVCVHHELQEGRDEPAESGLYRSQYHLTGDVPYMDMKFRLVGTRFEVKSVYKKT
jgi:hypothetical protein